MARIELITERAQTSTEEQASLFDSIVASRGKMIRPYEVLLHVPAMAETLSQLGAQIRFAGSLVDHDRELVILTAAVANDCQFEWDSHHPIAVEAGVSQEALDYLQGIPAELNDHEELIISYVRELHDRSTVSPDVFARGLESLGTSGIVELTVTAGYYTLLAYVMGAVDAC